MKTVAIVGVTILNGFLCALLFLMLTSCGWASGEAKHAAGSVVDCTKAKAKDAIKQFAPTVEQLVVNTVDAAGRADWNTIESATRDFSADVGGCVLQSVITRLLDPDIGPDGPQSSPLAIDRAELAHGWDELRQQRYGGSLFRGAQ